MTLLPLLQDGSTVAAVLVLDDVVYSANLGDSKAVLCRRSASNQDQLSFVPLTKDHNPSNVRKGTVLTLCCNLANIVVVVLTDNDLALIRIKQEKKDNPIYGTPIRAKGTIGTGGRTSSG